ncbi:mechanosensitive ion channel family protein [Romboutsia sp.]|uniref:mechanosensitive ion channel family protein n=1 Tax=Romboutsia sp. TaxID=1965302 RepID=UPI003F3ECFC0
MPKSEKAVEEVTKNLEQLQNIDISKVDVSNSIDKLVEWSATGLFKLVVGFIVISIGFKIIKRVVNQIIKFLEKREVDITLLKFSRSLISAALKIALVMPVLGYWGIDLTGIAALVASAGVAIGLALQGSLSNFAGGFIILLIRPFKVGDYIETTVYGGEVEQIGLFYTTLKTVDNKQVLIPNGILSNGSLINYSANPTRRVDLMFSVSYDSDIQHVKNVLADIVHNHKMIIQDPEPLIRMSAHSPSSIDFAVRAWCNTEDYWTVHFDLLEEVKVRFDKENIGIPYPQMDLHVRQIK